jgi:[ribosomal protein S5]-alanine N-acetyltransferase
VAFFIRFALYPTYITMPVVLETNRLVLRQFSIDDAPFILELLNTPGWLRYIGNRGIKTLTDAQSYLVNGPLMAYAKQGYGLCMVETKEASKPIGMCGLLKRDYLEHPDVGYALLTDCESQGYAHEIVSAVVQYAFHKLHFKVVNAITLPDNYKSTRLLHKLGFQQQSNIILEDKKLLLFALSTGNN